MGTVSHVIELSQVNCGYEDKEILHNVAFGIEKGTFTVIMGRNGSGKTTLLKTMAGLLPFTGSLTLFGRQITALSLPERAAHLAFLSQQHKGVFSFTVQEVVMTGRSGFIRFTPTSYDYKAVDEALDRAGISILRNRFYTELSGGEQQMVMIARLLAQQSPVLLMDEPISHLDYPNQLKILALSKALVAEGKTIVMILHDPNQAFRYGQKFLFVDGEKVIQAKGDNPWDEPAFDSITGHTLKAIRHEHEIAFVPKRPGEQMG